MTPTTNMNNDMVPSILTLKPPNFSSTRTCDSKAATNRWNKHIKTVWSSGPVKVKLVVKHFSTYAGLLLQSNQRLYPRLQWLQRQEMHLSLSHTHTHSLSEVTISMVHKIVHRWSFHFPFFIYHHRSIYFFQEAKQQFFGSINIFLSSAFWALLLQNVTNFLVWGLEVYTHNGPQWHHWVEFFFKSKCINPFHWNLAAASDSYQ